MRPDPLPAPAILRSRALILQSLRRTLDDLGFVEVETPVRIPAPANELHIEAPPSGRAFLRASPELQMKRLLAAGHERIYQIGPCFRQGERGARHNPEFTMLEWYRAASDSDAIAADLEQMVCAAALALHGSLHFAWRGRQLNLARPWPRRSISEVFLQHAGWDPVAEYDADRFDQDLSFLVEPALPRERPCLLDGYPAAAAALSRLCHNDPRKADRWEAYLGGMEICNAFGELTDAAEQRARFEQAAGARRAMGSVAYPLDEEFLDALAGGMPPAGGAALGVDRLCMALLDCDEIADVRAFCQPVGALW